MYDIYIYNIYISDMYIYTYIIHIFVLPRHGRFASALPAATRSTGVSA